MIMPSIRPFEHFQTILLQASKAGSAPPVWHPGKAGALDTWLQPEVILSRPEQLTPECLRRIGDIRAVVFDLDDTLIARHSWGIRPELIAMLHRLQKAGFKLGIVTNNTHPSYCQRFRDQLEAEGLHLPFVENAIKPTSAGFKAICKHFGLKPHQVAAVGDNRFTDTLGARMAGLHPIMVQWYFKSPDWLFSAKYYARQVIKQTYRELRSLFLPQARPRYINFESP